MLNRIKWTLIFCGSLFILIGTFMIINENYVAERNKCVRLIVNEDYIGNGCDKYFLNDKWYKIFMKDMYKEYNENLKGDK